MAGKGIRWTGVGRGASVVLALLAAAGCAREPDPNLALACQVQNCVCRPATPPLLSPIKTTEVLWKDNGDAYCQTGYVLRRAE